MAKLQQRTWFNPMPRSAHPNAASLAPVHGKKARPDSGHCQGTVRARRM